MQKILKNHLMLIVGAAVMALSLNLFLIPHGIAPGGVSGLGIIINHIVDIPVGALVLCINIPIFFIGLKNFSYRFMLSSLFGMIVLSVAIDALSFLKPITNDLLLASLCGGVLLGLGIGIVFRYGSTTGGTDVLAQVLKKHFPDFSVGRFMLIIDSFVVVLSGLVYGKWEIMLYSGIALFISSYIIDLLLEGVDFAKMVYVVSDKPHEIANAVSENLSHGSTILHGSSAYTGLDKTVVMCIVKKYEINKLKSIIFETDPNAFVIISEVREVFGQGFKN